MRRSNYCRVLLFLVFLFSGSASAEYYYWAVNATPTAPKFDTPLAYCQNVMSTTYASQGGYILLGTFEQTDTTSRCQRKYVANGNVFTFGWVIRYGDSCPPDQSFNSTTGKCDAPPPDECEAKAGQPHPFTKTGNSGDSYAVVVNGYVVANQSACFSGCAVNTVDQKCTGRVSGAFACTGTGYFTGQNCEVSGDGSLIDENTTAEPEPEPKTIADQVPCTYTTQPDDTQACESLISEEREGQYCGTVNGVKKCVDSKPTKNGLSVLTTVSSVTDANGKTVTTKKDTATVTKCTGANQCSSTSATTTTVTTTNGNGDVESVSGTCTGTACPDKNGNPDGDGDGLGDCVGDDCGEGGGPGGIDTPELDDEVPGFGETLQAFMSDLEQAPIIASLSGITVPSGGSFPTGSVSLPFGNFDFNFLADMAPTILNPMRYVFLALWAWAAIRLLFTA